MPNQSKNDSETVRSRNLTAGTKETGTNFKVFENF